MLAGYTQIYTPNACVCHRIGASIDKIRDLDYAIRLQLNINYAHFKLMAWPIIAWNLPWIILKPIALLAVPALTGVGGCSRCNCRR